MGYQAGVDACTSPCHHTVSSIYTFDTTQLPPGTLNIVWFPLHIILDKIIRAKLPCEGTYSVWFYPLKLLQTDLSAPQCRANRFSVHAVYSIVVGHMFSTDGGRRIWWFHSYSHACTFPSCRMLLPAVETVCGSPIEHGRFSSLWLNPRNVDFLCLRLHNWELDPCVFLQFPPLFLWNTYFYFKQCLLLLSSWWLVLI